MKCPQFPLNERKRYAQRTRKKAKTRYHHYYQSDDVAITRV